MIIKALSLWDTTCYSSEHFKLHTNDVPIFLYLLSAGITDIITTRLNKQKAAIIIWFYDVYDLFLSKLLKLLRHFQMISREFLHIEKSQLG